ncbi:MAG: L-2-amino-thiazoline-4-carboxylic acid hydrolase, partial [Candidatus Abyssubacteria bacterium]|nr:L-2-amino-thiazoline-4-carboxylic acid hydrolase [Candidatus Abyssubacteria bacterium]
MTDDKEKIEALRKDLFMATVNRGLVYTAILKEMREQLGEEKASEIFKRAIYNHGKNTAKLFDVPDTLAEFKGWLLDFFPDGGAMNEPEVIRCDEEELAVKLPRCPLKEG